MSKKYNDLTAIISQLRLMADPEVKAYKEAKFAVYAENSLGIYVKDLKLLAKEIKKDDELAIDLFNSGIYEAQLLCSYLFNPKSITSQLIDQWVATFNTWELCDSFCMSFMGQSPYSYDKIFELVKSSSEFQKRAGFVLMVGHHFGQKKAPNDEFIKFLPLIKQASTDERNFVKKAVNWALRTIGKRNKDLNRLAIETANEIVHMESKAAKWIARDAIKELTSPKVKIQDYPRAVYRPN